MWETHFLMIFFPYQDISNTLCDSFCDRKSFTKNTLACFESLSFRQSFSTCLLCLLFCLSRWCWPFGDFWLEVFWIFWQSFIRVYFFFWKSLCLWIVFFFALFVTLCLSWMKLKMTPDVIS